VVSPGAGENEAGQHGPDPRPGDPGARCAARARARGTSNDIADVGIDGGGGTDKLAGGGGRDACVGNAGKDKATCERERSL
jgi:hypothetical protein